PAVIAGIPRIAWRVLLQHAGQHDHDPGIDCAVLVGDSAGLYPPARRHRVKAERYRHKIKQVFVLARGPCYLTHGPFFAPAAFRRGLTNCSGPAKISLVYWH